MGRQQNVRIVERVRGIVENLFDRLQISRVGIFDTPKACDLGGSEGAVRDVVSEAEAGSFLDTGEVER